MSQQSVLCVRVATERFLSLRGLILNAAMCLRPPATFGLHSLSQIIQACLADFTVIASASGAEWV